MKKLKIVYFGTPDFSAQLLKKLVEAKDLPIEIVGVVTQPDKKVGRKQVVTPSPVKTAATEFGIPLNPDPKSADLALLFAFGEIISKDVLSQPKHGFWNVHPSLLPKYRGPSPVAEPLLRDDKETGVSIMKMDEELDHGPIIAQQKRFIFPLDRRDQLTERLVALSFDMLKELFGKYAGNIESVPMTEQDHSKATYTKKLTKQDGFIEISELRTENLELMHEIFNKFRAYCPWPGIWTRLRLPTMARQARSPLTTMARQARSPLTTMARQARSPLTTMARQAPVEKRLKITKIHWENEKIAIKKVQLEGKTEVEFEAFRLSYPAIL